MPPRRDDETQALFEQAEAKGRRRKRGRITLIAVATAVVLAGLITGVVLASEQPGGSGGQQPGGTATEQPGGGGGSATSLSVAQASTTEGTMTTITQPTNSTTTASPGTTPVSVLTGPGWTLPSVQTNPTVYSTPSSAGSAPGTPSAPGPLTGKVIAVDPGHQGHANSALEPVGPGSSTKKAKVSSGTSSTLTGVPESRVALDIGLKLRDALTSLGATVVMTRTTQDVDISNIQRAQVGNNANADLTVRLHCNGSGDSSVHGLFTLYPATIKGWTDDIAAASKRAATIAQRDLIAATGAKDRGLQQRSDLTGFNWSDVPVILVEMGFMSNPTEDKQLRSGAYQDKIVEGLVQGVIDFVTTQ